jgi:hypothetical protein
MTYEQAKYRLQLLAELGLGKISRRAGTAEDAAYAALKEATGGSG